MSDLGPLRRKVWEEGMGCEKMESDRVKLRLLEGGVRRRFVLEWAWEVV